MTPTDLRLIDGLRAAAGTLAASLIDPADAEIANTMRIVLDELHKRRDVARYRAAHDEAADLVAAGLALLGLPAENLPRFGDDVDGDIVRAAIDCVAKRLAETVAALSDVDDAPAIALIDRALAWEARLWRSNVGPAEASAAALDLAPENLAAYLAGRLPDGSPEIVAVAQVPGGFSKITVLVTVRDGRGEHGIVLRAQKPVAPFYMDGADVASEFEALRFLHAAGLPVAEPLWLEDDASRLGLRFLATTRLRGRNCGDFLGARETLPDGLVRELIATLARIHAVPLDVGDPLLQRSHLGKWARHDRIADATAHYVRYWHAIAERSQALSSPAVARGFAWLFANVPDDDAPTCLIHGDFGLHNVMVDDGRLAGVLDWEACHVGDPADELFLFTRALAPIADPERIMAWYVEAGGTPISPRRLNYYAVLAALKGPITGAGALDLVASHPDLDLKATEVAYRFVQPSLEQMPALIAAAEAARHHPFPVSE